MAKSRTPGYAVHPVVAYTQSIIENLDARTDRSIDEWVALLRAEGPAGGKARRAWLKEKHGLGGTSASLIADFAEGKGEENRSPEAYLRAADGWVEAMYAGPKAALRPLHDALLAACRALGDDVKACPCRTIVPLYRSHVFAEIKPAARDRVDLGLALKGAAGPLPPRLTDTGGLARGDRITHRIPIASLADIDGEVRRWLRTAYGLDA